MSSLYVTQAAIECASGNCMKVGLIALVVLIATITITFLIIPKRSQILNKTNGGETDGKKIN